MDAANSARAKIAARAAAALRKFAPQTVRQPVMIGFDGFVDSIISVVDKRQDAEHFQPLTAIEQLGRKILAAAGQSSNYELVVQLEKLGGNGPIMANAMAAFGLPVTYIGALGYPVVHPVFEELGRRAECLSIAGPGLTDALEFRDGKLMFGKHQTLKQVNWERIVEVIGADRFEQVVGRSRLLGMVNWTMLPNVNGIWRQLIDQVLPRLGGPRRLIFIDLADPEKRTPDDLRGGLALCSAFQKHADVILGLNLKEALQAAQALGIQTADDPERAIEPMARALCEQLGLKTVVIHPRSGAAACTRQGRQLASASFAGPLVAAPKISTGAGDVFNAGFCLARLAELPLAESLCVGTAASGYYVRHAASPTLEELATFLEDLPLPQTASV